jgi:hypothetical protein
MVFQKAAFEVIVAENAHYMDEREYWTAGSFDTFEEAVAAAKRIVDTSLDEAFKAGGSAKEFYDHYLHWGCDPFIKGIGGGQGGGKFSAWDYAKERCSAMANKHD